MPLRLFPPWGLELRSESFMFDLVSTISNILLRWFSWRAAMRMLRGLYRGVIMSDKTIFIVLWFFSYKIYGGPMGILFICKSFYYSYYLTNLYIFLLFLYWNFSGVYHFFIVMPVYDSAIEEVSCWGDREPGGKISCRICIIVCVKEVGLFLCLLISVWTDLEKHLCRISFNFKFSFLNT